MDKHFLLRALYETGTSALLTTDELRLYALFLAAAGGNGRGVLPFSVISEALGPLHHPGGLTFMCRRLEELGLIQLHSPPVASGGVAYRLKGPIIAVTGIGIVHPPGDKNGDLNVPQ